MFGSSDNKAEAPPQSPNKSRCASMASQGLIGGTQTILSLIICNFLHYITIYVEIVHTILYIYIYLQRSSKSPFSTATVPATHCLGISLADQKPWIPTDSTESTTDPHRHDSELRAKLRPLCHFTTFQTKEQENSSAFWSVSENAMDL